MTRVLPLLGLLATATAALPHDAAAGAPATAASSDACSDRTPGGIESPPALPVALIVVTQAPHGAVTCEPLVAITAAPATAAPLVVAPKTSPPARH